MWMLLPAAAAQPWVQAEDARSVLSVGPAGVQSCEQVDEVSWVCPPGDEALIDGTRLVAFSEGDAPTGGQPSPSSRAVLVEVDRGPVDMAPMVQLRAGPDSVELSCSDDGQFPDRVGNDDIPTCGGVGLAGSSWEIEVRAGTKQSWTVEVGEGELVQLRLTDEAELTAWPLSAPAAEEPPATTAQPSAEPPPSQAQDQPHGQSQHQPPRGASSNSADGTLAWSIVGAIVAMGVGLLIGRRRGRLPAQVSWSKARLETVRSLPALHGAVLSLGAEVPGAMALESDDVLDVLDALEGLRDRQPALPLNLVLGQPLRSPGEVGLTPIQRLLQDAPAGTVIYCLEGDA